MTEILRAAVGIFAALAPFGLIPAVLALPHGDAEGDSRTVSTVPLAAVTALAVLLIAVALTDPFLAFLDVSGENFQAGAAVIMLPLAAQLLWSGRSLGAGHLPANRPWLLPLAIPGLAAPASLAAVVAYSGRYGEAEAAAAAALAIALAGAVLLAGGFLQRALGDLPISVLGRLSGALLIAIGVELVIDGVQSV